MNTLNLTIRLTFTEDANVTELDKETIIENVLTALRNQVNNGMGLAPDAPEKDEYITELIDVRDDKGMGQTWDLKNDCSV